MAYLSGYTKRKKIVISNSNVISDLTNFPVRVKITSDADIGAVVRSDGYDVRFTAVDGTTLLDHEREIFSVTSGSASGTFWVCVPTVASAANTEIYIYFGKADASDASVITFWDADYSNIYHFGEAGSGLNDSSANGNHLTNNGLTISGGKAANDGTGYATASFEGLFSETTTRMISALARTAGGTGRRVILGFGMHENDFEPLLGHRYDGLDSNLSFEVGRAGVATAGVNTSITVTSSDIYHIATVYKSTGEVDFYVNGVYNSSFTYPSFVVGQHEIQHLAFSTVPTKGQFLLDGASGNVTYADGFGTLVAVLGGGGVVNVTGDYTVGFDVEFIADYADKTLLSETNNSLAVDGSVSVVINQEGDGSNDETQTITVNSGTGTFTVSWTGYGTTSALAHGCSTAEFQTAIDALFGSGNTSVGGPGNGPWVVTFISSLTLTDIPTPTFDVSALNIPVTITITTPQTPITPATTLDASGDVLVVGAELYESAESYNFNGDIYEARYSLIERSVPWIKFEAKNMLDAGELTFNSLESSESSTQSLFPQKRILICV